ncbi:MAG: hypothetical protein JJE25_02125 [Bacteroidia bacterium]|nr:hypothetical protein [Bacteroidia bacterium]
MIKSPWKYFNVAAFCIFCAVLVFNSCTKDMPASDPENPFSLPVVHHDTDTTTVQIPDQYSITGLHTNIFSVRCNVPGCHDGTFEPDFRTIQSTYSTLVYQHVNKVTVNGVDSFYYRVIPFDTTKSFIHERLTTPTTDYMPSNGNRLSQTQIQQINRWIMQGAKDINGNIPVAPNNLPGLSYYLAFDSVSAAYVPLASHKVDSIRYQGVSYNPFVVQQGKTITMYFIVSDDSTSAGNLLVNELKLSLDKNNFTAATVIPAFYAVIYPVWIAQFNVTWPIGTQVFFRYYVKDTDNPVVVEFPRNEQPFYYKSYYSFIVQ